ncbi:MAG: DNA polymerase/3'-5' exonuclease PolX [Syntrophobacterales bacterium]|nr:DNA polymerase/3'-5' exonuclease PolX [Syntrophobacterales bacterium]
MPVHNSDIASIFDEIADMLEIQGDNPFRVRAYRNAARSIAGLPMSVADMVERGEDLTVLQGIGKELAAKITEIVKTGTLAKLKEIEERTPPELSRLMKVAGLGPKRVKVLYEKLGVKDFEGLRQAAEKHLIRELPGFGEKTEQKILEDIAGAEKRGQRVKLVVAEEVARSLVGHLSKARGVKNVEVAGSYRRRCETVGDLDILAVCGEGSDIMDRFVNYENVKTVMSRGDTKAAAVLRTGIQVDVRVVPEESYGAALHYFTGSKAHNIAVRTIGVKRDLKVNEYGVFRGDRRIAGRTEEEVYRQVGLPYIEPELREDRGEIEAAREGRLPKLVTEEDIRGDLHVHTKATDGRHSIEEVAGEAMRRGYEYIAVTDHSKRVTVAGGIDSKRLVEQVKEIDRLNERLAGFVVLKAVEVDILEDGSLDLPDEALALLDLTVCAVHSKFNLSRKKQTERIIRAMDNPFFNILAHPTGRLIDERNPYDVDMEALIEAARERGCFLELNGHPDRLDLSDIHCKAAKEAGVKIAVSTDAHSMNDLKLMRFGVYQARRGWLGPEDVLNTRRLSDLKKLLIRR